MFGRKSNIISNTSLDVEQNILNILEEDELFNEFSDITNISRKKMTTGIRIELQH
jgi:hypothetical protein